LAFFHSRAQALRRAAVARRARALPTRALENGKEWILLFVYLRFFRQLSAIRHQGFAPLSSIPLWMVGQPQLRIRERREKDRSTDAALPAATARTNNES